MFTKSNNFTEKTLARSLALKLRSPLLSDACNSMCLLAATPKKSFVPR
ncbi:hypothetical protein [Chroococcidiopsis sp. CCNUC1]|nr:hypothetical protein [Chroococcidiopsis sp. CCNUC1]URD51445.1 hypothetical protein M5J74_05540 [Chroococcidiopsis sp. CCNUC1]